MIEAVTFDFWNTIATVPPGAMKEARQRAIAAAAVSGDVEIEADLLLASLEQVGLDWERSWAEGRHLPPHEAAAGLVRALGLEGAAREMVAEAFLGAGREVELEFAPGIHACLESLREREVRLGIVCDVGFSGGELLRELLEAEGLLRHFDGWAFSDEVGHYKPSPQIFEAALAALGAEPASALHVGDLRRTDVAGAAAHGMRTVRYRGMNDEGEADAGPEAEFVLDSHDELVELIFSLGRD
ncbi:MAG TPA: HAD family hydrolase [Solirubrobacterales bacterium]|nr:HAD family hydrolase [Solirubrobacterales bacterium]